MRAIEEGSAWRDLVERLNEYRAAVAKPFNDELVVNDLVIDVQWRPEEIESALEAFNCHIDPGAKASGIRQDDLHREATSGFRGARRPYPIRLAGQRKGESGRARSRRPCAMLESR